MNWLEVAACTSSVLVVQMSSAVDVEGLLRRHKSVSSSMGPSSSVYCSASISFLQACGRFQSCVNRGLHAHHPRDCLYFMRDFTVEQLQGFLRENNVEFETKPSQEQLDKGKGEGEGEGDGEAAAGQEGEGESVFTSSTK